MNRITLNPHKSAALAYGGLGVLVILITFAAELVPPTRTDAVGQLVIGAAFVAIFALLIYRRGWWPLSALLVISNTWRAINFFNLGIGLHVDARTLSILPVEAGPVAFVNAALMAAVVFMLARSARIGFSAWRDRRSIAGAS